MKRVCGLGIMFFVFFGISFASTTGTRFGGTYLASTAASETSPVSSVAEHIAVSETYDVPSSGGLTDEEIQDIESLIFLVIEKQRGTLILTAKDVVKARNMQRTYMLATMVPETGASDGPIPVMNVFPTHLPATGSAGRNIVYLLLACLGCIGLVVTLSWKQD